MANWLNQLQSLLGQSSSSTSSSADQGLGKLLVPGALGGLAGLLVANKSARKLLTKYGTNALLELQAAGLVVSAHGGQHKSVTQSVAA